MGKDIHSLLEEVKGVDWKGKMNDVMASLKPYALSVGRTAARPLLQFWFLMVIALIMSLTQCQCARTKTASESIDVPPGLSLEDSVVFIENERYKDGPVSVFL